jgi:predicted RNA binding protein YcfA (HicA-like mRNA interferase family)
MAKLRRLSGADVVSILEGLGFAAVSQRGSHIKLKRTTERGTQTLTVPAHRKSTAERSVQYFGRRRGSSLRRNLVCISMCEAFRPHAFAMAPPGNMGAPESVWAAPMNRGRPH